MSAASGIRPASGPGSASVLDASLSRLIVVIEEENAALRANRIVSHAGYTERKNLALCELLGLQRLSEHEMVDHSTLSVLAKLLQLNAELLKRHIGALGEVSDIIIGTMREADSDGTYSRGPRSLQR